MVEPSSEGSSPKRLPSFLSFEKRAEEAGISGLNAAVKRIGYPENALDTEENSTMRLILARPYARLLCDGAEDTLVVDAAHNALYFATAIGSYFIGSRTLPLFPFDRTCDRPTLKQKILDDQAAYLTDKPNLRTWIARYIHSLDPSGSCHDVVTAVIAVTLKQFEERERLGFIDAETIFMGDV